MPCFETDCPRTCLLEIGSLLARTALRSIEHAASAMCIRCVEQRMPTERKCCIGKGPAVGGQNNRRLEETLQGDDIKEEFWDMEIKEKFPGLLLNCVEDARKLVQKCPIFLFGRARQGKSTVLNDLVQALGSNERPATEDHYKACTQGVKVHRWQCKGWTTPGVEEELLLFDTEGWELGKQAVDLLDQCMQKAKDKQESIGEEVLHQRLVLVLVLGAENRHEIHDKKFHQLIKEVCDQATRAAERGQGGKPVLLPVVSKEDLFEDSDIRATTGRDFRKMLSEKIGQQMDVRDPVFIGRDKKDADPKRPCILELKDRLSNICQEQLASVHILRAVQLIMENKLMQELEKWEKEGVDPSHSLVRRFLWVVARHRNLRIRNLYEEHCTLSWAKAREKAQEIRSFTSSGDTIEGLDSWHSDPLRRKCLLKKETLDTLGSFGMPSREATTSASSWAFDEGTPEGPTWDPYLANTASKHSKKGKK